MKYKLPGLASIFGLALWLPQQWLTQYLGSNYANFPWKWLFFISLSFLIGVVYSDLFNEQSAIPDDAKNGTQFCVELIK